MTDESDSKNLVEIEISRQKFLLVAGAGIAGLSALSPNESWIANAAGKSLALVSTQKAGDNGPIDDMIHNGLQKAGRDFHLTTRFIEANDPSAYESTLRSLAQAGTNIVATTFLEMAAPIKAVAPSFPKTRFIQIYADPFTPPIKNVVTVSYDFYLGTFLSGILAARGSRTKKLGYIGGTNIPGLLADYHSYTFGARRLRKGVIPKEAFAGSFQDPAKGHEIAAAMYAGGVDFIQTDAAATDLGIIKAAKEKGGFVIGDVGKANWPTAQRNMVGTVILLFGRSLYNQVKAVLNPNFTGHHMKSGLVDGIVGIAVSPYFLQSGPPDVVKNVRAAMPLVNRARQQVINGSVHVPEITH